MNLMTEIAAADPARLLKSVIDAKQMLPAISEAFGLRLESLAIERVHFSKSRPPIILYLCRAAGSNEAVPFMAELMGQGAAGHFRAEVKKLRKDRRAQIRQKGWGSIALIEEFGLVVRRPGLDAKLAGLRLLHDLPLALEVIGNATGCSVDGATLFMSLRAHRLGKRAVLCADFGTASGEKKRCYLRLRPKTSPEGAAAFARHRIIASELAAATGIRAPAALHFEAAWGAAIYSDVQGLAPDFADRHVHGATRVGDALAVLRMHGPVIGSEWRVEDEIAGLMQWPELIGTYIPERQGAFDAALQGVAEDLIRLRDVQALPCHRDFHEGQVLLTEDSCGVIDFDTWCRADPALDIGNFAAHVRLWEMRTGGSAEVFSCGFLKAAGGGDSEIPSRIAIWKRAALLRLAAMLAFTSERTEVVDRLLLGSFT